MAANVADSGDNKGWNIDFEASMSGVCNPLSLLGNMFAQHRALKAAAE